MKVTWELPDGTTVTADVKPGTTLMEAGVANNVKGIIGECGGNMICATCHVRVHDDWLEKTGDISEFEDATLDLTDAERDAGSRLSCQITMTEELDGLVLIVPEA